ncbi:ABC transporter ATP-binding protein [Enterococcus wangshanyuanii]|uniref:ABC transporter ATP-binding protein n=1 Tax=Enterococcus wangshanyuanii TaxID=2005703 RepID=A0ABQ1NLR5_9ENTE|nr:ABC transporter ATP-binding protein [Enterococcus wangshanyuanii]GGC80321.1 ABC transporter ATP-binding protein [Enterococcus wangshanyuanii]
METLAIKGLSKSFNGNKVIDDISFTLSEGEILGFIGANGAGKTTTMKMILGLLPADSGEIYVCGEKVSFGQTKTNRHIGYLPDVPEFYGYMRPKEYLRLCGEIVGLDSTMLDERIGTLLTLVGLSKNNKISGFSRGMKQRLGIAQALLNEPKLLILDEPTSALDPIGRKEILDLLNQVKGKTTVIFSTHVLSDVERICDKVAILDQGKIALQGSLDELRDQRSSHSLLIEFSSLENRDRLLALTELSKEDIIIKDLVITIKVEHLEKTQRMLLDLLSEHGILPRKLEVLEPTLESLYMEVVK